MAFGSICLIFIQNLSYAANNAQALKPYAPWIQYAIEQILRRKKFSPNMPKILTPPIHETFRVVKDIGKGKTPVGAESSISAPAPKVKKATVEIPKEENPLLYAICLRTQ